VTSERKVASNRANSRASTGPKSPPGRARSARNALRHGLNLPVHSDPVFSEEVEELAALIAGLHRSEEIRESARRVAEAEIDVRRVREARRQLLAGPDLELTSAQAPPGYFTSILLKNAARLRALDRYERRARCRRKLAIRAFEQKMFIVKKQRRPV
jgi:hypothetical protein